MGNRPISNSSSLPKISNAWLVFLIIWPFGALIRSLRQFRFPQSKTVFWLFCIFFGFVFIIPEDAPGAADSARYARQLIEAHSQPLSFNHLLTMFYAEGGFVDIYQPLLTWFVAIFTGNPQILMAVFGAVFGFFYAQNLWMVFSRINSKVGLTLLLFMLVFGLLIPIWYINGVRMYTAAHVFLFGCMKYFLHNEKNGLTWSVSSILFHFSFMFPVAILFLYIFLPRKAMLFFVFYIATSFVNEINLVELRNFLSFLPDAFQPRVESYTSEDYAERIFESRGERSLHVQLSSIAIQFFIYAWVFVVFIKRKFWARKLPDFYQLFLFALFLGGFTKLAALVPSGGRFIIIPNAMFIAVFLAILGQSKVYLQLKLLKQFTIPLILYSIIFSIRMGFERAGVLTIFGNPIIATFIDDKTPIINLIKQFF